MNIPELIKRGDKAMIVAPSGKLPKQGIDSAINLLKKWGLEVKLGEYLYSTNGVFAGTDAERKCDFQMALDDSAIKLILCARGGYGFSRFIDSLSYSSFIRYPKWVVGFSDITAFHLDAIHKEILTIHGPMATSFSREGSEKSIFALHELLFDGKSTIETRAKQLKTGVVSGELVGGNLALICDSLGTSSEISTENRILVIEDVGEYYYRIDRLLNQLFRAGKLSKLKGLVVGNFTEIVNGETSFTDTIEEMVERTMQEFNFPIALSMPIGHEPQNFPFVHGAEYRLEVTENTATLDLLTTL